MADRIRFGDFVREISVKQNEINFNDVVHNTKHMTPRDRVHLRPMDVYRLLRPYVSVRFIEQLKAVVPLAVYLALFQMLILRQSVEDSWIITGGLFSVIVGLMLFMEGLKQGLMPFGETIGTQLPKKSPLWLVLLIAFLLGIGVTFAEPAIGALKTAGSIVDVNAAPYLYALLNLWTDKLVLVVGAGVGLAAVLGTLRFLYGWSLKPLIYWTLVPVLGLTVFSAADPHLSTALGLAWDCGAVTTGPVTVPLVLSLGIGVAAAGGKGHTSISGFGIVTLASLFPILGVLALSVYVSTVMTPDQIIEMASTAMASVDSSVALNWWEKTPGLEFVSGVRAILPLVLFLFLVLSVILREKLEHAGYIFYGITLAVVGMVVFNIGLTLGLAKLGGQAGGLVPAAFTAIDGVESSPLYLYSMGIMIAVSFAWFLGFGATLAEPALNALGITVENLTNGAFKKSMLVYAVSFGVGFGILIGVTKIIYDIPIAYLLVPGYFLGVVLTALSTEEYVNIAWDSAGVTTGPVTVPLVLSMGLGFGNAMSAVEGFGILSMASICPILSVLSLGLYVQAKAKKKRVLEESHA